MRGVNRVVLVGRLGEDPQSKQFDSGRQLTTFSVATAESWKDIRTGERVLRTQWHRVVSWDNGAKMAAEYLSKGQEVCVEGRLKTRKWQDREGKDHSRTEIVADAITFLTERSPHRIEAMN